MSPPPPPTSLTNLNLRESITDTIYRATEAYDTNDYNLLASALHADVTFDVAGQTMTGLATVKTQNFDHVGAMDTTHFITNIRIHVDPSDETRASATCHALAQHYPTGTGVGPEERRLLVGALYSMEFMRDDDKEDKGLWKIKKWVLKIVWTEGDMSVLAP